MEILKMIRRRWHGKGTTTGFRFHDICGSNIAINRNRTAAFRGSGFSHGLCFSRCPLLPGQLFLVEIADAQDGWSGHLRIGVTQHNPENLDPIPEMTIPQMTVDGKTWVTAVTKFHNRIHNKSKEILGFADECCDSGPKSDIASFANQRISVKELYFLARRELTFTSSGSRFPDFGQSVFIGSRIGVTLVPLDDYGYEIITMEDEGHLSGVGVPTHCNMHLVINGEDQGPSVTFIPLDRPLYVVVDVYSTTTQVNLIPLFCLGSLKDLAREQIRTMVRNGDYEILPLPTSLKDFCQYR